MTGPSHPRIGMDGLNLALPQGTGVATYARNLARAAREMGAPLDLIYGLNVPPGTAREARETLFFSALAEGRNGNEPPERISPWGRVRRQFIPAWPRDLVEVPLRGRVARQEVAARVPDCDRLFTSHRLFYRAGRYLRRHGRLMPVRVPDPPAIMHWTYPVPVKLLGARNVYTIHDLVPLRLPYLSLEDKAYHERLLRQCAAEAAHIATVSEASRNDILAHLPVDETGVTNLYQPVVARHGTARPAEEIAAQLGALFGLEPQGYLLFLGAIEPKKNLARLIEAYLAAPIATPLVIAGPEGWGAEDALRLAGPGYPGARRIRRLGYLPDGQLDLLLRGARALLFPSLHEGFGLPAAEAMLAGVPVIAGDVGGLREVVGDAGVLVDPHDVAAIRAAILAVDGDAALRNRLAAAGQARIAAFAMQPYQARLQALHARLLAEPPALPGVPPLRLPLPFLAGERIR